MIRRNSQHISKCQVNHHTYAAVDSSPATNLVSSSSVDLPRAAAVPIDCTYNERDSFSAVEMTHSPLASVLFWFLPCSAPVSRTKKNKADVLKSFTKLTISTTVYIPTEIYECSRFNNDAPHAIITSPPIIQCHCVWDFRMETSTFDKETEHQAFKHQKSYFIIVLN